MKNPNEYDDTAYTEASNKLFEAVYAMWAAGATALEIQTDVDDALAQVDR